MEPFHQKLHPPFQHSLSTRDGVLHSLSLFLFYLKRIWIAKDGLLKTRQGNVITKDKIVAIKHFALNFLLLFCAAAQIKLFTQFVLEDKERKTLSDWEKQKSRRGESGVQRGCVRIKRKNKSSLWDLCSITRRQNTCVHLDFWKSVLLKAQIYSSSKHPITCLNFP